MRPAAPGFSVLVVAPDSANWLVDDLRAEPAVTGAVRVATWSEAARMLAGPDRGTVDGVVLATTTEYDDGQGRGAGAALGALPVVLYEDRDPSAVGAPRHYVCRDLDWQVCAVAAAAGRAGGVRGIADALVRARAAHGPGAAPYAFLCHASEDKPAVHDLHRRLVADGIRCWIDEDDILPGRPWHNEIEDAISKVDYVLVCLSSASVAKRGFVQREMRMAVEATDEYPDGSNALIPVRLEECEVPRQIRHRHHVDLFAPDGYRKLLDALRRAEPGRFGRR